jgi:protocatechuate 3,4-dioxygenase beta subunit
VITPSQTVGPFFGPALLRDATNAIAGEGEPVRLEGRVLDGDGAPVADALLELWRADPPGFARVGLEPSDADPVLARVPPARRGTLLARREGDVYRWDVVLQGEPERETAFFTWVSS